MIPLCEELKQELKEDYVRKAFAINDYEMIYDNLHWKFRLADGSNYVLSQFTQMLLELDVNPLRYMDFVPDNFLEHAMIKEFTIPKGIKTIGACAFETCRNLQSIIIPEGVTLIKPRAFIYCNGLRSITLPNTLLQIADNAFFNCSSLEKIYFNGTKDEWDKIDIKARNNVFRVPTVEIIYMKE